MRWTRFFGGGQNYWYLVDSTGRVHLAKHEDEMTLELWRMAR